jgi:hypothetical protein
VFITKIKIRKEYMLVPVTVVALVIAAVVPVLLTFKTSAIIPMMNPASDSKPMTTRTQINVVKYKRILLVSKTVDVVSSEIYGDL